MSQPNREALKGEYVEMMRNKFIKIIDNQEWEKIDPFYIELEEDGYPELSAQFSQLMTDEDVVDYKKWAKGAYGDTTALIDDNS